MNETYVEEFRTRLLKIHQDIRKFVFRAGLIRNKYVKKGMDAAAADEARQEAFAESRNFILEEGEKIRDYLEESEELAKEIGAKKIAGLLDGIKTFLNTVINLTAKGIYPKTELDTLRTFAVLHQTALKNRIAHYLESLY